MENFWIIGLIILAVAMIISAVYVDKNTEDEKASLAKFIEDSGGNNITIERIMKWNNQKFKHFHIHYRDSENKWRKAEVLCKFTAWGRSTNQFYWPIPNEKILSSTDFDLKSFNNDQLFPHSNYRSGLSSKEQIISDLSNENRKLKTEIKKLRKISNDQPGAS